MKGFAAIANSQKPLTIVARLSVFDVCGGFVLDTPLMPAGRAEREILQIANEQLEMSGIPLT